MLKQAMKVMDTSKLTGQNYVKSQHIVAYVSTNEMLEARVSLHGLVISSDKIHAPIPST